MLVSHRKKFIYTKTAKTASTSVESYFEMYCMPMGEWEFQHARDEYESEAGIIGYRGPETPGKRWFNHMAAEKIRDAVGPEVWDSYFKFSVIRNPFDKLVSGFFFAEKESGSAAELIAGFRAWVKSGGEIIDRHTYTIDGALCLDYFIRYENLEAGIHEVCDVLGIPFEADRLPRLKAAFRQRDIPLADFYDEETTEIVRTKYAFELAQFNYHSPLA